MEVFIISSKSLFFSLFASKVVSGKSWKRTLGSSYFSLTISSERPTCYCYYLLLLLCLVTCGKRKDSSSCILSFFNNYFFVVINELCFVYFSVLILLADEVVSTLFYEQIIWGPDLKALSFGTYFFIF